MLSQTPLQSGSKAYALRLIWLGVALIVGMTAAAIAGSLIAGTWGNTSRSVLLVQAALQGLIGFAGSAWLAVCRFEPRPWQFLGVSRLCGWVPFGLAIAVLLAGIPLLNYLIALNEAMHLPPSWQGVETTLRQWEQSGAQLTAKLLEGEGVGTLLSGILVIGLVTGFCEELFFRGALQKTLSDNGAYAVTAIWVGAFIFSAAHFQFFGFIPRFLLGAFFGYLLYLSGSIWPGVMAHALNNSMVVTSSWLQQRGHDLSWLEKAGTVSEGEFPCLALISGFLVIGILLLGHRKCASTASGH